MQFPRPYRIVLLLLALSFGGRAAMGVQPVREPVVKKDWFRTLTPKSIVSVQGEDGFGASPWLLASDSDLENPALRPTVRIPDRGEWRVGHFMFGQELRAFLALLPPDFDSDHPKIWQVVVMVGSGDNRVRSLATDLEGFIPPPGVLVVGFDLKMLSLATQADESDGPQILAAGISYIYQSLGLSRSATPCYMMGLSLGGGAALYLATDEMKLFDGIVAISPMFAPWDIYSASPEFLRPSAKRDEWAEAFALVKPNPEFPASRYAMIGGLFKMAFGKPPAYRSSHPFRPEKHLHTPVLVMVGSEDDLGAFPLALAWAYNGIWKGDKVAPLSYGPEDATREIDFMALANFCKPAGAVLLVFRGGGHDTVVLSGIPGLNSGRGMDTRVIALSFFRALGFRPGS